jgi:hypothetical protein
MFAVSAFNRDVKKIGNLLQSMKRHGFICAYPIHCSQMEDGRLEIKAGHHRFECAKALGLPVYYVVSNDAATIAELERATRPWKLEDYVKSHERSGDLNSALVVAFASRTGICVASVAAILGGELAASKNKMQSIKEGRFKPTAEGIRRMEKIEKVVLACTESKISFACKALFVNSLSKLMFLDEFDESIIVHKARTNPQLFHNCATEDAFLEMLEHVHNYGRSDKRPLAFLAKEAAKSRNKAFSKASAR